MKYHIPDFYILFNYYLGNGNINNLYIIKYVGTYKTTINLRFLCKF